MTKEELINIIKLADSKDIECKKLAISLLESEYPDALSYNDYMHTNEKWIFKEGYEYYIEMYYYEFIIYGYIPYLIRNCHIIEIKNRYNIKYPLGLSYDGEEIFPCFLN